ncbi:MAG: hemolysin family protein [Myxococcota bacterium]|nr:hemolysin family protein [Myxococcota bacterium]
MTELTQLLWRSGELFLEALPVVVVAGCIVSEAFFAAAELSILSADQLKLEALAEEDDGAAARAVWFRAHPDQLFGTTLLGTNISTVTGSTVASLTLLRLAPEQAGWLAMLIMAPLVLMGGEIIPKSLAQSQAERYARRLAPPLYLCNQLLSPVVKLVSRYTAYLSRLFKLPEGRGGITREELIYLVREEGEIEAEAEEREILDRILAFRHIEAADSMVPLAEMVALPKGATVRDAVQLIMEEGFSRLPVYDERVDQVVGVLHHLDLISASSADAPIEPLLRPAFFVPERQEIDEILVLLQRASASAAIVVDEFGGAVGLLTLEDIVEEIVGEIQDEFDAPRVPWRQIGTALYTVSGRAEVEVLNEALDLGLPLSSDYETLAGYMLSELRRIPIPGETLTLPSGATLRVRLASERAIEEITLRLPSPLSNSEAE